MAKTRENTLEATKNAVCLASRRRCCLCFIFDHDDDEKAGQIAHLDKNPSNNAEDNLAFLCFNHHDKFDSRTSQSRNYNASEVKICREKLYAHLGSWLTLRSSKELLNFLASSIGLEEMADAAIKVGDRATLGGADYARIVLTETEIDLCDGMIYIPIFQILDHFQSWGWLKYEAEEKEDEDGNLRVYITINHEPICKQVAEVIAEKLKVKSG